MDNEPVPDIILYSSLRNITSLRIFNAIVVDDVALPQAFLAHMPTATKVSLSFSESATIPDGAVETIRAAPEIAGELYLDTCFPAHADAALAVTQALGLSVIVYSITLSPNFRYPLLVNNVTFLSAAHLVRLADLRIVIPIATCMFTAESRALWQYACRIVRSAQRTVRTIRFTFDCDGVCTDELAHRIAELDLRELTNALEGLILFHSALFVLRTNPRRPQPTWLDIQTIHENWTPAGLAEFGPFTRDVEESDNIYSILLRPQDPIPADATWAVNE